jgi:6-phosphogluconolactonase
MEMELKVFDSLELLATELAEEIGSSLYYGGCAALASGTSPLITYEVLAGRCSLPWERITFIPTDERALPRGDPGRNDTALERIFFGRPCRIIDLCEVLETQAEGQTRQSFFDSILPFQVTLLGLGEDGHTASLFPLSSALTEKGPLIRVTDAPKPPSERITLSIPVLNRSGKVLFCVTGSSKRNALHALLNGLNIPAGILEPEGPVYVYADRDAVGP